MRLFKMSQSLRLTPALSVILYRFPTTGMILVLPTHTHMGRGGVLIPVESLLVLDLQDGGVVVQDGQDDFVHVLPQA